MLGREVVGKVALGALLRSVLNLCPFLFRDVRGRALVPASLLFFLLLADALAIRIQVIADRSHSLRVETTRQAILIRLLHVGVGGMWAEVAVRLESQRGRCRHAGGVTVPGLSLMTLLADGTELRMTAQ